MRIKTKLLQDAVKAGYILSFVKCDGCKKDQILLSYIGAEYHSTGKQTIKKDQVHFSDHIKEIECKQIVFPMPRVMRMYF